MQESAKILVAAHKPYWMPSDAMYVPVQAGAALAESPIEGFQPDNTGDNISAQNPRYCELTALYWGWKNLLAEGAAATPTTTPAATPAPATPAPTTPTHLGLAHYRRHFKGTGERHTLTQQDLAPLLKKAPVVLPQPRNYYIETIEAHYGHTFDPVHIECLRAALETTAPQYLDTFNKHMAGTRAHMFNMFVMRRDLLDAYCTWLFDVLRIAEYGIDFDVLTPFEARCMGRLSERLLDTWIDFNGVQYAERPVVNMEHTPWLKKGGSFLAAKYGGRKYKGSF